MDSQHLEGCLLANDIELRGIACALEAAYEGRLACICNLTGRKPLHTWMPPPELPRFGCIEGEMRQPICLLIATVTANNVDPPEFQRSLLSHTALAYVYHTLS